jgi:hypothetical protein
VSVRECGCACVGVSAMYAHVFSYVSPSQCAVVSVGLHLSHAVCVFVSLVCHLVYSPT